MNHFNFKFRWPGSRGFTLVELMVALALSVFLIGGVVLMFTSGRTAIGDSENLSRLQENMRFAAESMIRDIRQAGFEPDCEFSLHEDNRPGCLFGAGQPHGPWAEFSENQLIVRHVADTDCAGVETNSPDLVAVNTYTLVGDNLQCNGESMIGGVSSLGFTQLFSTNNNWIGVQVTLGLDDGHPDPDPNLVYRIAFRNAVLDEVFER